jgi:asparagine synthetase B (glutamine-hydrolysing)
LLKRSVKDIVPDEIINRPKQGFWAPFLDWYINDPDFCLKIKDEITKSQLIKDALLNQKYIEKILNTRKFNERTILKVWSILILTKFYDYYFKTTN